MIPTTAAQNPLDFLWNLFTDGGKELFTTRFYGLCFEKGGWKTIRGRLERRHFEDHFLGRGKGDYGIMVPWRSRWFRIDIDNHRRGVKNDRLFLAKVVAVYDQLVRYGAPQVDGIPALWTFEVRRTLTGAHFDFFFHRPLFTALKFDPIPGRTKGAEMECGNELLCTFLEIVDDVYETDVFSTLELPVSGKNCRLPFGRDYQLILDDVYDWHCEYPDIFGNWIHDGLGHLDTEDLLRFSVLGDLCPVDSTDYEVLLHELPQRPISESGENIYMSSTDSKADSIAAVDHRIQEAMADQGSSKSVGMWDRLTSFWKGDLPVKQYENDRSNDKILRAASETYKILRFEQSDHDEAVQVLNDLIDGLPEKCRRSDLFNAEDSERLSMIGNVVDQTEKWLSIHPEAITLLENTARCFARKGRFFHRSETWNQVDYSDDYSAYPIREIPFEVVNEIRSVEHWSGRTCRSCPDGLLDRIPELVSYLCHVADLRGSKDEPFGLELVMILVQREFRVGLHKMFASQLINYLITKGYLALLRDYTKKVRGRTLGMGEPFRALPLIKCPKRTSPTVPDLR